MRLRGVCVDLDDTLFPQSAWLDGAWAAVADRAGALGLDGAVLLPELLRVAAQGSDRGGIIDRALTGVGVQPGPYVADLVAAFARHAPARLPTYPGVLEALTALAAAVPVVVVTDGNPVVQRAKLAALGLGALVPHVVVSDELGGRQLRKPHPAPFRAALDLLAVPAGEAVHVGDRPGKDVAGAEAVGMRCVRVRTGEYAGQPDDPGLAPWRSVGTFAEAVALLLPLAIPEHQLPLAMREQDGASARL
jgi:FMN phosphatase YigB (HAD superfamily)